jgi:2-polyprenyl-3-methyl-5-hydroxy-6-metoxy-1,4-benzoquinol methylase
MGGIDRMNLREEWIELLDKSQKIYIYGAGKIGGLIYDLIQEYGAYSKLVGFIVSDTRSNPIKYKNLPVFSVLDETIDKSSTILVAISFPQNGEVAKQLEAKGFNNIVNAYIYKYCKKVPNIDFGFEIQDGKNKCSQELFLSKLKEYFHDGQSDFGRGDFYQSLPILNIEGQRPTDVRIKEYGVHSFLNKDQEALDLGCNCGFFDITISSAVKSIFGLEINQNLVNIANAVAQYLDIYNLEFECNEFKYWNKSNKRKFDVIFSFAVHQWFEVDAVEYANLLNGLLNDRGYIFFESQDIKTDIMYLDIVKEFCQLGFDIVKEGFIKDDGIIERKYYVLKKSRG